MTIQEPTHGHNHDPTIPYTAAGYGSASVSTKDSPPNKKAFIGVQTNAEYMRCRINRTISPPPPPT